MNDKTSEIESLGKKNKAPEDNIENIELMIDGILKEDDVSVCSSYMDQYDTYNNYEGNQQPLRIQQKNSTNIVDSNELKKRMSLEMPKRTNNKISSINNETTNLALDLNAKPFHANNSNINRNEKRFYTNFQTNNRFNPNMNMFQYQGDPNQYNNNNYNYNNRPLKMGDFQNPQFRSPYQHMSGQSSTGPSNYSDSSKFYNVNSQGSNKFENIMEYDSNNSNMSNMDPMFYNMGTGKSLFVPNNTNERIEDKNRGNINQNRNTKNNTSLSKNILINFT